MDLSPEYRKMCKEAKEIQKLASSFSFKDYDDYEDEHGFYGGLPWLQEYWLPRQDQLQEIVGCSPGSHTEIIHKFADAEYFFSLEQKWLAFVMKERFQKKWDNNEWRIEDDRDKG